MENDISFDEYYTTLNEQCQLRHTMNTFLSKNHQVQSVSINKVSLSCFDDKRYISEDGISTLAHGHYRIVLFIFYCLPLFNKAGTHPY